MPDAMPPPTDERHGLVYVAFGYEFLLMATLSASSAKDHNPDIHCSLVTNMPVLHGTNAVRDTFDDIHRVDSDRETNRLYKTRAPEFTPCDRAAYIDCDTLIRGSLDPLFRALDSFDVILKMNAEPHRKDFQIADGLPGHLFPFFNGGLVVFRKTQQVTTFFRGWRDEMNAMGGNTDQPALARTVFAHPDLRVLPVNAIWNTFPPEVPRVTTESGVFRSRIWHYRSPADTPQVIHRLRTQHPAVMASLADFDHAVTEDIRRTLRRYRLLGSIWYRNPVLRKLLKGTYQALRIFGVEPPIRLRKQKAAIGDKFREVDDNEL